MGKGNRNSQQRLENQLANEEKFLAKEKANKNKKNSGKVVAAVCIIFAIIVVAVIVLNVFAETGVFIRATDTVWQDDVVVDAAMMTFFINDHITNWYNNYYIYVAYGLIKLDMTKDFKTQKLTSNDAYYMGDESLVGTTWYDYFINTVTESVEMYVTYASAAKANNISISNEDMAEIDETIKSMKDSLKEYGMSFADQYGKGVTEKDVRKCYELIYLASAYGEQMKADFEATIEAEKDQNSVLTYVDDNKGAFFSAKYVAYSISVSEKSLGSEEKYDAAVKDAKAAADKIAAAKTPADFVALVEEYKKSPAKFVGTEEATGTEADSKKESETKKTESSTATVEDYEETIYHQTGNELGDWIFAETEPAKKNDTLKVEETGTETDKVTTSKNTETTTEKETESGDKTSSAKKEYKTYKVTVYMLTAEPDLDRSNTHNFAYMISDNKDAAQAFLDEFLASSTKNGDIFEDMAKKHYDKLFEGHDHENHEEGESDPVFNYSQVDQGKELYFADSYGAINDWLDNDERKSGDYTAKLIEITVENSDKTKTTYYAALYFEDQDDPAWYVDAFAGATQKMIDDWYQAELDKKLIKYNFDAIGDITLIRYSNSGAS